jgi:hypothetical protein
VLAEHRRLLRGSGRGGDRAAVRTEGTEGTGREQSAVGDASIARSRAAGRTDGAEAEGPVHDPGARRARAAGLRLVSARDIVWAKTNPMPESTRDRPTKSHEYVFLLAKSEHYFYDADAIREATGPRRTTRGESSGVKHGGTSRALAKHIRAKRCRGRPAAAATAAASGRSRRRRTRARTSRRSRRGWSSRASSPARPRTAAARSAARRTSAS